MFEWLKKLGSEKVEPVKSTVQLPQKSPITTVSFLLVQCDDDAIFRCEELIAAVHSVAHKEGGVLIYDMFSLLCYCYGVPTSRPDNASACRRTGEALVKLFPDEIRVAIGRGNFLVNSYGPENLMRIGPMIQGLSGHIETLLKSPPGKVIELKVSPVVRSSN